MRILATLVVAGVLLAACAGGGPATPGPSVSTEREAAEQTFGPDYPAQPPSGRPMRVDRANLSDDSLTLTVGFVGGKPFLATDPCSEDYEPWVAATVDELDVIVVNVDRGNRAGLGAGVACTQEGYLLTYHLRLAAPFTGTTVKDSANSATLFVRKPPGAARATALPAGWSLQRELEEEPGPPATWMEVYAAAPVADDADWGPGRLYLYQVFGISPEWTDTGAEKFRERGASQVPVTINGIPATVWNDAATGDLLLAWTLGGQSMAMIGNSADMTPAQLAQYASGVSTATP